MKIAIHNSRQGFHPNWISYCEINNIPFKIVDCYSNNIINDLRDCFALMWHHSHINAKDLIIAKQILFGLEHTGFRVFPDFKSNWHFDDKIGQKYLLELVNAPMVPSYVFYSKRDATKWIEETSFPKVFKLRGGAGSSNVKLVHNKFQAKKLVRKAFGRGFSNYDTTAKLKERYRKWKLGMVGFYDVVKGIFRLFAPLPFAKVVGKELGYVYFQDFIPNNNSDTRIIVIAKKAFALKRYVRKNDFRASGSGEIGYAKELFDERCVQISFELSQKLQLQVGVYDFIFDKNNNPIVVEFSYGYTKEAYYECPGYWDNDLIWHQGKFNHEGWMVDLLTEK